MCAFSLESRPSAYPGRCSTNASLMRKPRMESPRNSSCSLSSSGAPPPIPFSCTCELCVSARSSSSRLPNRCPIALSREERSGRMTVNRWRALLLLDFHLSGSSGSRRIRATGFHLRRAHFFSLCKLPDAGVQIRHGHHFVEQRESLIGLLGQIIYCGKLHHGHWVGGFTDRLLHFGNGHFVVLTRPGSIPQGGVP